MLGGLAYRSIAALVKRGLSQRVREVNDYPVDPLGIGDSLPGFKTALADFSSGGRLIVRRGRYRFKIASDSDTLLLSSDFMLDCEEGVIFEWDYLGSPLFAIVDKENVLIQGPMFEWDGTLAEVLGSPGATRFGWAGAGANRDYCAHILSLGSHGVRVKHGGCRTKGDAPAAATDGFMIFLGNYSKADGVTRVRDNSIEDCRIDDVLQGALVYGQENFRFKQIVQRRYLGDHPVGGGAGINGHILYQTDAIDLPSRGLEVDDVVDHGVGVGSTAGRSDAAVQIKSVEAPIVRGVHSRRPAGIMSLFGLEGGNISDCVWRPASTTSNGIGTGESFGVGVEDVVMRNMSFILPDNSDNAAWNMFKLRRSSIEALISAAHTTAAIPSSILTESSDNHIDVKYIARNTTTVQPCHPVTLSHRNTIIAHLIGQNQQVRLFNDAGCLDNVLLAGSYNPTAKWTNLSLWSTEADSPTIGHASLRKSRVHRVVSGGTNPTTTFQLPRPGVYLGIVQLMEDTGAHLRGGLYRIVWDTGSLQSVELLGTQWTVGASAPTVLGLAVSNAGVVTMTSTAISESWDFQYDFMSLGNNRYTDY